MNDTLEGINSRKIGTEEQMDDPEDRLVEISAAEQNI